MDCERYKETVAAHVDGALAAPEEAEVRAHLELCARCSRIYEWESKAAGILKEKLRHLSPGPGLEEAVLARLREASSGERTLFAPRIAWAAALALGVAGLLAAYLAMNRRGAPDLFADAVAKYHEASRAAPGEASPRAGPQVFGLERWGYAPVVTYVERVGAHRARVSLYRGANGEYLLAREIEGIQLVVPSGAVKRRLSGREFFAYSRDNVNVVAWKDGELACFLASAAAEEKLLELARRVPAGS
jgi:hypothetical protein